jgi:hypothetical protein
VPARSVVTLTAAAVMLVGCSVPGAATDPAADRERTPSDPSDPMDETTWDVAEDHSRIQRRFLGIADRFEAGSRAGYEALADATWLDHTADSLVACDWDGAFPGYDVLDEHRFRYEYSWSNLVPRPGWELSGGWGSPTDDGYRVYSADFTTHTSYVLSGIPERDRTDAAGHVAVAADTDVVFFPACDDTLPSS